MSNIHIELIEGGRTRVTHQESGAVIQSQSAFAAGDHPDSFSATDLLAASVGSCIASSLEPFAMRWDIPLDSIQLHLEKVMQQRPSAISKLDVRIAVAHELSESMILRMKRVADTCLVKKALREDLPVEIVVEAG